MSDTVLTVKFQKFLHLMYYKLKKYQNLLNISFKYVNTYLTNFKVYISIIGNLKSKKQNFTMFMSQLYKLHSLPFIIRFKFELSKKIVKNFQLRNVTLFLVFL